MELEHARLLQQGWHQLPDGTYRKGEREIWVTCPDCCGEGSTEEPRPSHDDPYGAVVIKCERCGGSGWERE
jgi:hypothetical protein